MSIFELYYTVLSMLSLYRYFKDTSEMHYKQMLILFFLSGLQLIVIYMEWSDKYAHKCV